MPVVVHTELFVHLGDILQFPRHFASKFRIFVIQKRRGAVGMLKNSLIEAANQTAKQSTNEAIFFSKTTRLCIKVYFSISRHIINLLKPNTLCTTSFNVQKLCVLPTMHLCVLRGSQNKQRFFFSLYRINLSDFITEEECLLRGTNWVFKSDRYNFVLKGMVGNWTHRIATTSYVIISL